MKLSVKFRPKATRDVLDEMLYLEEQANKQTALRFYDAVKTTCGLIAERPLIGKRMQLQIGLGEEVRWLAAGGAFSKFWCFIR